VPQKPSSKAVTKGHFPKKKPFRKGGVSPDSGGGRNNNNNKNNNNNNTQVRWAQESCSTQGIY
jgi:hypothetical protein